MTTNNPLSTYEVLDSVAASAADWTLDNGVFKLSNTAICRFSDIVKASVTASVAETAGKETLTFTAANNTTYSILIQQFNPNKNRWVDREYFYTTAATGDTATTIGDSFRAQINADTAAGVLFVAATGTTTLIMDTSAGYPIFFVKVTNVGGGTAQASTGPNYVKGVAAIGTLAALALEGITVTNAAYTTVRIQHTPTTGYKISDSVKNLSTYTLYINEGDGDAADLVAKVSYSLAGRQISAGGPADPEAIAHL